MSKVLIIGGDAANIMAAASVASTDHEIHIYGKNEKLGKKIYITRKGWCNVTNTCDMDTLFQSIVTNPKFLYNGLRGLNNRDMMDLLGECGCPLKAERGMRAFPVSGKSSDVIRALVKRSEESDMTVHYHQPVQDLLLEDGRCVGLILEKNREKVHGDTAAVATGGLPCQAIGPTGDGYWFAEKAGHQATESSPALVPFEVKELVVKSLQGLALKNTEATILDGEKELYREFGEMLLTYFGVSGPALLSANNCVAKMLQERTLTLSIDLKLALTREQLDARLLREFEGVSDKQLKSVPVHACLAKLLPVMAEHSGISPEKRVNEIIREEQQKIVEITKNLRLTITGLRDYREAIITRSGVSVKEVNPSTMKLKRVAGLYFAGEVLGLDAVAGEPNLQIA